jgi:hypothetical protein
MADPSWWAHAKILESGHAVEWISGATGALGAVLGSVVTVTWTEVFNRRTRTRERNERIRVGAFSLSQKLMQIYQDADVIIKHINNGFANAALKNLAYASQTTTAMVQHPSVIEFSIEEKWAAIQVRAPNLLTEINGLDRGCNTLNAAMARYDFEREKVSKDMPISRMENGDVFTPVSDADRVKFEAKYGALHQLLEGIRNNALGIHEAAFNALRTLAYAPSKPLGPKFSVIFMMPDGSEVAINAVDAPKPEFRWRFWK